MERRFELSGRDTVRGVARGRERLREVCERSLGLRPHKEILIQETRDILDRMLSWGRLGKGGRA